MQSLAKIVHSLSIKDFICLQNAGHSNDVLLQILNIKIDALMILKTLANGKALRLANPIAHHTSHNMSSSIISDIYASYLIWWLGMGSRTTNIISSLLKLTQLALQVLLLKEII